MRPSPRASLISPLASSSLEGTSWVSPSPAIDSNGIGLRHTVPDRKTSDDDAVVLVGGVESKLDARAVDETNRLGLGDFGLEEINDSDQIGLLDRNESILALDSDVFRFEVNTRGLGLNEANAVLNENIGNSVTTLEFGYSGTAVAGTWGATKVSNNNPARKICSRTLTGDNEELAVARPSDVVRKNAPPPWILQERVRSWLIISMRPGTMSSSSFFGASA